MLLLYVVALLFLFLSNCLQWNTLNQIIFCEYYVLLFHLHLFCQITLPLIPLTSNESTYNPMVLSVWYINFYLFSIYICDIYSRFVVITSINGFSLWEAVIRKCVYIHNIWIINDPNWVIILFLCRGVINFIVKAPP